MTKGLIYGINGPIVYLKNAKGFQMAEMVYVGNEKLVGEVVSLKGDGAGRMLKSFMVVY